MDKLTRYRFILKQLLTDRANLMRSQPLLGEEVVCLLDEATDNYMLLRLGWLHGKRLYSVTLHLRLVHQKVQIEQDWTEDLIAELTEAGVPTEDIVFAFTSPDPCSTADLATV